MVTQLPYDELDIIITRDGFYITPVLENERVPKEEFESNLLFQANLAEASTILEENTEVVPDEVSSDSTSEDKRVPINSSVNYKINQQSIQIKPPTLLSPTLSQNLPEELLETDKEPELKVIFSASSSDVKPIVVDTFKDRIFLQILFDKSKPPCEIDNFTPSEPFKRFRMFGIVGYIQLLAGWHLAVIRSIRQVGSIQKKGIFHIESIQLLPFDYDASVAALEEGELESFEETPLLSNPELTSNSVNLFDRLKAVASTSPKGSKPPPKTNNLEGSLKGLALNLAEEDHTGSRINSPGISTVDIGFEVPTDSSSVVDGDSPDSPDSPSRLTPLSSPLLKKAKTQDELLDARIKREIYKLFGAEGNMYVSYSFDITSSLQRQERKEPKPFWQTVTPQFWWNRPLQGELVSGGLHRWILPVVQGFVQTEQCELDTFPFTVTLISRRDTRRLGMRYQRRGVNEDGNVANFAETEQILEMTRGANEAHICSFLQIRGSIPLFWSQSPYSLKPVPMLERGGAENLDSVIKHLASLRCDYGPSIHIVSLTEQNGRESIIGSAYSSYVASSREKASALLGNVRFLEFDFHKETRGIGNLNLAPLVLKLDSSFNEMEYFWRVSGVDAPFTTQKGVFRVNCMDCLDRTNVVQSTLARQVLNLQLFRLGLQEHPDEGLAFHTALELTINALWANNGDALSRAYAGTGALKADMTRTGKRNLQGIVNDATNSLTRFYFNAFKDFFTQAVLDYLQGHHELDKFREVAETHIATEPGLESRLGRVRQSAVQTSATLVLQEGELLIGGWVLLSPIRPCRLFHSKLEEKVVLLTKNRLYICSFHFGLEKVLGFVSISLEHILKLQFGAYYLTLNDLRDLKTVDEDAVPVNNYDGLVIHYLSKDQESPLSLKSLVSAPKIMQYMSGATATSSKVEVDNPSISSKPEEVGTSDSKLAPRFIALKGLTNLEPASNHRPANTKARSISLDSKCDTELYSITNSMEAVVECDFKKEIITESKLNAKTLSSFDTVQQLLGQLQQAHTNRISVLSKTKPDQTLAPLLVVNSTIQSASTLKKKLYPAGAGLLLAPKLLGSKLFKTFT